MTKNLDKNGTTEVYKLLYNCTRQVLNILIRSNGRFDIFQFYLGKISIKKISKIKWQNIKKIKSESDFQNLYLISFLNYYKRWGKFESYKKGNLNFFK